MEHELDGLQPPPGVRTASDFFGRMLVISLFLHVICTVVFLSSPKGTIGRGAVHYLDLSMVEPPAPASRQETAKVQEVPPAPPETPSLPASPPSELETLQKGLHEAIESASSAPESMQKVSLGFGITNGQFSSLSDGKTLRDDMREYYLSMLEKFNEKWWLGRAKELEVMRGAVIMVSISRDGVLVDSRMVESSGNPAYDRAMLETLRETTPLPPLPATYEGDYFKAPIRFVAPLNLLAPKTWG